jgi:O-acetylhomoserine/O-acetylserine sulfhydrylase-like pyridoxal-dependent enzyme
MADEETHRFDTLVIHSGQSPESWEGATLSPIFQTASNLQPTGEMSITLHRTLERRSL